eukprot:10338456-Alexandrium_andersonii.AAC.1
MMRRVCHPATVSLARRGEAVDVAWLPRLRRAACGRGTCHPRTRRRRHRPEVTVRLYDTSFILQIGLRFGVLVVT